jgi:hypothetical protein
MKEKTLVEAGNVQWLLSTWTIDSWLSMEAFFWGVRAGRPKQRVPKFPICSPPPKSSQYRLTWRREWHKQLHNNGSCCVRFGALKNFWCLFCVLFSVSEILAAPHGRLKQAASEQAHASAQSRSLLRYHPHHHSSCAKCVFPFFWIWCWWAELIENLSNSCCFNNGEETNWFRIPMVIDHGSILVVWGSFWKWMCGFNFFLFSSHL